MKILCISDHIDPIVYSTTIKSRFADVDIVMSSGDLPLNYYDFIVSSLNKPLLFVFGNHNLKRMCLYKKTKTDIPGVEGKDSYEMDYRHVGATYIGDRIVREKGLLIGGLGGSIWYNGEENQYTDTHMYFKVIKLIPRLIWNRIFYRRFIDILLTHAPPYRINDCPDRCHTGFKAFCWFIKAFKPKYLIHGHIHLYDCNSSRETKYCDTKVINAYDHCLVELEIPDE